jgi:cystathionine beta-lyase/cystathionine gamma-synthase
MDEYLVIDNETNTYNRHNYTELNKLKDTISNKYDCNNIVITSSGMHAISTSINLFINLDIKYNIIYSKELYFESINYFNHIQNKNINKYVFDINNLESLKNILINLKESYNILYFETCSNPNGYIFDFRIIQELRKISNNLIIIVDNSWLSNCIFNPFIWYIDIVVISLTKYYSAGMAIAGACLFKDKFFFEIVEREFKINGFHVSPENIRIINNNIHDQLNRIVNSSNNTIDIIDYLQKNISSKIISINHPYINIHSSYNLAKLFFNKINNNIVYPPVFTIILNIKYNELKKILMNNKYIENKTSFGTKKSRTDTWYNEDYTFLRLSIGYDDSIDNIINGINEILI